MTEVKTQLNVYSSDVSGLLHNSKEIIENVKYKVHILDSGFAAIKQTVDAAKEITSSVKQVSSAVAQRIRAKSKQEE
ncbi:hypothetical protein D3C86_1965480 [compost metagenome]